MKRREGGAHSVQRGSRTRRLAASLGVALGLLVFLFLVGDVELGDVFGTLSRLSLATYASALGLHAITTFLRAVRFQLLIPSPARPDLGRALAIAAAHNMASYVLPLKAGEASLILYLKLQCGTPGAVSLAALLVSRFLDAAALCVGLAVAFFGLEGAGGAPRWVGMAALALVLLGVAFLAMSLRGDLLVRGFETGLRWLRVQRLSHGRSFLERLNKLALALRAASGGSRLALASLATLPMWFTIFGFFSLLAHAFGIPDSVTFLECALGASLASLANLLPVNAAAGAGTQELGWVTGFAVVLGVDEGLALTTGLGVHLVQFVNVVAMGLAAHLALGVLPRWPRERA